jgi:hypothetical protein
LVRILGARGRERNERDRENDRNRAEHCFLPCFLRGDAAPTRLKNSAISGEFLLLRSTCSHMRDGEVCVRICSTVHAKRSTFRYPAGGMAHALRSSAVIREDGFWQAPAGHICRGRVCNRVGYEASPRRRDQF